MKSIKPYSKLISLFFLHISSLGAVGLEQGESNSFWANPKYYTESKYSAIAHRWSYTEAILGSWYGESSSRFIGLSGAYRSSGKAFYDVTGGVVYLIGYRGNQLDGNKQFNLSLGVGRRFNDLEVSIKFRHFSNGAYFLNDDNDKNRGVDFLVLHLKY